MSTNQYPLPDLEILKSENRYDFYIWQPDKRYIILGRANRPDSSVYIERAKRDNIEIFKRPSGGESVILSPKMLVFSAKFCHSRTDRPGSVFELINRHLISSLGQIGIENLYSKGISDLSINNRKIMGSSMYLTGSSLFYHSVLNISEEPSLLSVYLKHPSREPEYRQKRDHKEFVTSIHKEGYDIDMQTIKEAVVKAFENIFKEIGVYVNLLS